MHDIEMTEHINPRDFFGRLEQLRPFRLWVSSFVLEKLNLYSHPLDHALFQLIHNHLTYPPKIKQYGEQTNVSFSVDRTVQSGWESYGAVDVVHLSAHLFQNEQQEYGIYIHLPSERLQMEHQPLPFKHLHVNYA